MFWFSDIYCTMFLIMNKTYLVIPTIRNLDFLKSWKNEFSNCHLIIVEDNKEKTIGLPNLNFLSISCYSHKDIEEEFKNDSWIFSRKNAGIRSYGFWKAYEKGADVILTIDDDCFPAEDNFVKKHIDNLDLKMSNKWQTTYPNPTWMYTRGFPYQTRNSTSVYLSHGIWSGALDLDAKVEIGLDRLLNEEPYPSFRQFLPLNVYYPMCSMNMAFKREITPLMFFPMMGENPDGEHWGYNRYDDIWAGILSKKIMDHLNMGVVNGSPIVEHKKASLPKNNLKMEKDTMFMNEVLWKKIDEVKLTAKTPKECYIELAKKTVFPKSKYFKKLSEAMIIWANLF